MCPLRLPTVEERGGKRVVVYVDDEDSYEPFDRLTSLRLVGAAGLVAVVPLDVDVVAVRLVPLELAS